MSGTPIPFERALELCDEAAAANRRRRWDPRTWQCWGCLRFSGEPAKRCFAGQPDNRGCPFVNERWDRYVAGPGH